jgi:NADH-ubiquinone oxidoreductase chain 6
MNSLFILNETYTNGYKVEILDFLSLLSILCGVFVIISKNPIVSILFLIGLFLSISIYLIMLGLNFIGISYLLVYVGAISILFLFILMLINIRISELLSSTSNTIPLAVIIAISFYTPMYEILPYSIATYTNYTENLNTAFNDIFFNNTNYLNNFIYNDIDEIVFVTSKL